MNNFKEILAYIDPSSLDYQDWVNVGMALHHEGESVDLWDAWSQRDPRRYHPGDCEKKWKSFGHGSSIVTGGTLVHMAEQNGYIPWSAQLLDWDDVIEYDGDDNVVVDDIGKLDSQEFNPEELGEFNPVEELKLYINTLFKPTDIIAYTVKSWKDEDGKYKPSGMGVFGRKARDILKALDKHPDDICESVGDYDPAAGAWIRFNPMDGKGVGNKNVAAYRYALVESDSISLGKQISIMEEMQLPIAVMLYSGGKSIHAIVRIDAKDSDEYFERVNYLYTACKNNQLVVDTQNKNPSRLSRMPGIVRNGKKQRIIKTNIGKASYDEWRDWIDGISDELPEFEDFYDEFRSGLPELAPELIEGVLRRGHKMLLTGPSKAGKSFALIQMCIALATGGDWMGHKCRKGEVLYVNFELDAASCKNRFYDVYSAMGIEPAKGITIWNLRGKSVPLNKLVPKLIRRASTRYSAIILDPIYKTLTGDENSAKDMSDFCGFIDRLARETEASIIYCHHHSKGSQSGKSSMDRGSGSGVFARDPDAIVDMVQINPADCDLSLDDGVTAWRLSYTLREFMSPLPREVLFDYPLHKITDQLHDAAEMYGASMAQKRERGQRSIQKRKEQDIKELHDWVENMYRTSLKPISLKELSDQYDKSESTLKRWIQDDRSGLDLDKGYVFLK